MKIEIPDSFCLLGERIHVVWDNDLFLRHNTFGMSDLARNFVVLQTPDDDIPLDKIEATFFHELFHFVLHFAKEDDIEPPLTDRESLVDRIGGLLHQALTTSSGNQLDDINA